MRALVRRPRRSQLVLVALLVGVLAAAPAVAHCLPGQSHHRHGPARQQSTLITASAATAAGGTGVSITPRRAQEAAHAALCHSVEALAATVRAETSPGLLAASAAALLAAATAVPLLAGISRGPPVRAAAISRSGRVLLTELCILRR
ncbi:hypothetical protein BAB75_02835 [Mycobacteroides immunogenum]|nr:hypothetical protein BAB75_02835 [Mycobacteroides immunogenum]